MSSYFQRLAAQTWNAPASSAPAPGSALSTESLLETSEEITAPSEATSPVLAMDTAVSLPGSTPQAVHSSAQELFAPSSPESHSILPPSEPISSTPKLPPKSPLPGSLGTLLPSTPIMEEVVRWLATPAVPAASTAPISSKFSPSKAQPTLAQPSIAVKSSTPPEISTISAAPEREEIPEVVIRHEPVSEESLSPVASRPTIRAPFSANKDRETAQRRESPIFEEIVSLQPPQQPDVTVKIGTIQVTIEAPALPIARTVERPPAPAPSRASGETARSAAANLSRHYITTF